MSVRRQDLSRPHELGPHKRSPVLALAASGAEGPVVPTCLSLYLSVRMCTNVSSLHEWLTTTWMPPETPIKP